MPTPTLAHSVRQASLRPDVRAAVQALYADLESRIQTRNPICQLSGRCCRFDEFGHRMYVTTLELAAFLHALTSTGRSPVASNPAGCPFQVGKLCGVRDIRPLPCRVFFCDPTSTDWQRDQAEEFHARLKSLHESLQVPYAYVEWRQALTILGIPTAVSSPITSIFPSTDMPGEGQGGGSLPPPPADNLKSF